MHHLNSQKKREVNATAVRSPNNKKITIISVIKIIIAFIANQDDNDDVDGDGKK